MSASASSHMTVVGTSCRLGASAPRVWTRRVADDRSSGLRVASARAASSASARTSGVELTDWARELRREAGDERVALVRDASNVESDPAALFKTKLFAFVYWRGYRQLFAAVGYPGKTAEVALALRALGSGETLLDVSCGSGLITDGLARSNAYGQVVAIDISPEMCNLARETCRDVDVYCCDVCDLPFVDESFDRVHSSAGAHCWRDAEAGFAQLFRVCKRGGCVFVSTVVLAQTTTSEEEYTASRMPNTPFWKPETIVSMMQKAGFENVQIVSRTGCFVSLKANRAA